MNKSISQNDLEKWQKNKLINPITNKTIKLNGPTYKSFEKEYNKLYAKSKSPDESGSLSILNQLINCYDDRDPISMNIFWTETNNNKTVVYPFDQLDQLVFYTDSKNKQRCLEKE